VTLTATASGLRQATAAMTPSAANLNPGSAAVWVLTQAFNENGISIPSPEPAILLAYDENATTNVAPLVRITGSATDLPALGEIDVGLAADQHGNISVAANNSIYTFAAGQTGNVAPSSITTFPAALGSLSGLVIDSAENAYFAEVNVSGSGCTLYRAPIINGSESPTPIGDCSQPIKNVTLSQQRVGGLAFDRSGNLLVGMTASASPSPPSGCCMLVVRYTPSGSTYLPSGAIQVADGYPEPEPSLDDAGDVTTFPYTYPGTSFVDDEVRSVPYIARLSAFGLALGQWAPNGSLFVLEITNSGTAQLRRYATDNGTMQTAPIATISSTDLDWGVALATGPFAQGAGSKIMVTPSSLSFNGAGSSETATETASETGYTGQIAQTNTCTGIATVTPASAAAPATFTITAVSAGSCTITYADSHSNTATSNVVVTTTILSGQSAKRR
jgi:hypothetical protein